MKSVQLQDGLHKSTFNDVNGLEDAAPSAATQLPNLKSVLLEDHLDEDKHGGGVKEAHAATRLPTELLYEILDNFDKLRDVAICARICSAWSARALEYLYRRDQANDRHAIKWALLNNQAATMRRTTTLFENPFRFEDLSLAIICDNDEAADAMLASEAVLDEWRWQGPAHEHDMGSSWHMSNCGHKHPAVDKYGRLPLVAAAARRNRRLVDKILALPGIGLESLENACWSPLSAACMSKASDLDLIVAGYKWNTQLCFNSRNSDKDDWPDVDADLGMVRALLEAGLDPKRRPCFPDMWPLYLAANSNRLDLMDLLLSYGANINTACDIYRSCIPLFGAATGGHPEAVKFLLERGANVHQTGHADRSALHETENVEVAELLLAAGLPIDLGRDESIEPSEQDWTSLPDQTPIGYAIMNERSSMVLFLLDRGANPLKAGCTMYKTTLNMAVEVGLVDVIPALYRAGVDPLQADGRGMSALVNAVNEDFVDIASVFVELGADFKQVSSVEEHSWFPPPRPPRRPICMSKSVEMVNVLAGSSGSLNDRIGNNGETVFHQALVYRRHYQGGEQVTRQIMARFVELGADMEMTCIKGFTAIHHAVQLSQHMTVDQLAELGADVNKPDAKGWTPLMWACRNKNVPTFTVLVNWGADIHATKPSEVVDGMEYPAESALDVAVRFGFGGAVKRLVEAGASLDQVNDPGNILVTRLVAKRQREQCKQVRRERRMAAKNDAMGEDGDAALSNTLAIRAA